MSRKPEERIADICQCCEKILKFTTGMNPDQFAENELVTDAVLQNIEIIGEATKHLPDDVRARMPDIEWKKIAGMRDIHSHVEYRIDPGIVWDVVENKVPGLLRSLRAIQDQSRMRSQRQDWGGSAATKTVPDGTNRGSLQDFRGP